MMPNCLTLSTRPACIESTRFTQHVRSGKAATKAVNIHRRLRSALEGCRQSAGLVTVEGLMGIRFEHLNVFLLKLIASVRLVAILLTRIAYLVSPAFNLRKKPIHA